MRPFVLAGLLLLVIGGFVLLQGFTVTSSKSVLKVGDFTASVDERQAVPAWVGALAVLGVVLLTAGGWRAG